MASIATLGLGACRGSSLVKGVGIEVDQELTKTQKEKRSLLSARVSSAEVHVPTPREGVTMYQFYFGSSDLGGVVRYLDERIAVLLAPGDLDLVITSRVSPQSAPVRDEGADDNGMTTIATNLGSLLWIAELTEPDRARPAVQANDRKIVANSMRSGITELDSGSFDERFSPVGSELAHEARHSDCTGGMHRRMIFDRPRQPTPAQNMCGHLHIRCPANHPLAGDYACDNHSWGAYTVSTIYSLSMYLDCKNCSERERLVMRMQGIEYQSRVLPWDDMAKGKSAPLDLTSSDKVID